MREVTINGKLFQVRGLKRKEVKQLRKEGLPLMNLQPENAEEAQDRVFEMVFNEGELAIIDEMDNKDALRLWQEILAETYGVGDETKNS